MGPTSGATDRDAAARLPATRILCKRVAARALMDAQLPAGSGQLPEGGA